MNDDLLAVVRDIESPPGGWKYTVPQTGVTITDGWFRGLRRKIVDHYTANGIPVTDDLMMVVEDGACRETQPPGWCRKRKAKPVAGKLPLLTLVVAERFIKTVWQVLKDRDFVPKEEALRRVSVCMSCPLATSIGGCESCHTLYKQALKLVGDGSGNVEKGKEFCGACGCLILAKTALSQKTLDKAEGSSRPLYWGGCWRNEK